MDRLNVLLNHLAVSRKFDFTVSKTAATKTSPPVFAFSPEDIVVVDAVRTPIGKSKRGSFVVK